MSSGQPADAWQRRSRVGLSLFYGLAGVLHIVWPGPFLSITPQWVPFPHTVIFLSGMCELAGAVGICLRWTRAAAAIGLALYAVCVYPANIKHAIDSLSVRDASVLTWLYHLPRLALQPAIVWLPLFASDLIRWPVTRRSIDEGRKSAVDYSTVEDICTVSTNGDSNRGRNAIPETGKTIPEPRRYSKVED